MDTDLQVLLLLILFIGCCFLFCWFGCSWCGFLLGFVWFSWLDFVGFVFFIFSYLALLKASKRFPNRIDIRFYFCLPVSPANPSKGPPGGLWICSLHFGDRFALKHSGFARFFSLWISFTGRFCTAESTLRGNTWKLWLTCWRFVKMRKKVRGEAQSWILLTYWKKAEWTQMREVKP